MKQTKFSVDTSCRVFFALWPEEHLQQKISDIARTVQTECHGNLVAAQNIHLTLVFIGEVKQAAIAQLVEAAKTVELKSFSLRLNRLGYFSQSKAAFLAPEQTPPELSSLVNNLQNALRNAQFSFDSKPFVPHITLLRKAGMRAEATIEPRIDWEVSGYALVQSRSLKDGVQYAVISQFGD
jgi:RNA 2',3'-cyclic 3'-phosphodiesterase